MNQLKVFIKEMCYRLPVRHYFGCNYSVSNSLGYFGKHDMQPHIPEYTATQVHTLPVQMFERMVLPLKLQLVSVDFVTCVLSSVVAVRVDPRQLAPFLR